MSQTWVPDNSAKRENDPSLAITPGVWFRTGTPAMLITLIVSSLAFLLILRFLQQSALEWINFRPNSMVEHLSV